MYPSLWEASGVPYAELIDELVRLALERHAHREGHGRAPLSDLSPAQPSRRKPTFIVTW